MLARLALAASLLVTPAAACSDLSLVILADVSDSMTDPERESMRRGIAQAFLTDDLLQRVKEGECDRIDVTYVEYSTLTKVVVGWTPIIDRTSSDAFADKILAYRPKHRKELGMMTAVNNAIKDALVLLDLAYPAHRRQILNVTDGINNHGGIDFIKKFLAWNATAGADEVVEISSIILKDGMVGMQQSDEALETQAKKLSYSGGFYVFTTGSLSIEQGVRIAISLEVG